MLRDVATVGVPIRVYGFAGEDLGIVEVPPPFASATSS